uniref:SOCS box domain-containing protein n=1 Tax=Arion vulgaris TaxID=1028688 RepID=A0A0B6ZRJ0_9EUPU
MASAEEPETELLDEFLEAFIKGMDCGQVELIDYLIRMKLKDPRFPLDTNRCAVLASKRGNVVALSKVLTLDHRMSYGDAHGRRAIHYAAKNGHLECVKLLLKAGSVSNCSDSFGRTPLHLACSMGHVDIVSYLVRQCAHINSCRTETGENAVHVTASTSHIEVMKLLIDNGGDVNAVTRHNKGEDTPLHKAVAADKADMVEYLCQRGAKLDISNAQEQCPIHIACEKGFLRCISILIRFGASLDVTDSHAQTPLCVAIVENQTTVAKLLVDEGASVHVADKHGYTAMHTASMRGNLELIDYFVAAGADVNVRTVDSLHTPLMSAVSLGRLDSIHTLISLGADVTLSDSKGHTPLHLVHMKLGGSAVDSIIRALLEGGCRLDTRDNGNLTPIQRGLIVSVIRKTNIFPWVQLLCQAGAVLGPDQFTMGKHSPLFWLTYSGLLKEALYLVRAGWDLGDETWVVLPGKNAVQDRLHKFMIETFRTVPSLLACCRKSLRSHLSTIGQHREIISSVDALPIPDPLKSFLKLYDIDPEDVLVLETEA